MLAIMTILSRIPGNWVLDLRAPYGSLRRFGGSAKASVREPSRRCPQLSASSPGGYFAGMLRKYEKGELRLAGTLWALREAKWGKRHKSVH
jgi:hypothetical protein